MEIQAEKPVENWTRFPNSILDNLDKFTLAEIAVLNLIVRKNYGFQEPSKRFSKNYIAKKIGISKKTVIKAVKGLIDKKTIKEVGSVDRGVKLFELNEKDTTGVKNTPVEKLHRCKKDTCTGVKSTLVPVEKIHPVKENRVQENKTVKENTPPISPQGELGRNSEIPNVSDSVGKNSFPPGPSEKPTGHKSKKFDPLPMCPADVDPETWSAFMEVRIAARAKNTERAINMLVKKLAGFQAQGMNPEEIVQNSVMNSWKGVFELKNQNRPVNNRKPAIPVNGYADNHANGIKRPQLGFSNGELSPIAEELYLDGLEIYEELKREDEEKKRHAN